MLTDSKLRTIKPGTYADTGGLYLRVSPKGKKTWTIRRQKDGRNTWEKLGEYPGLPLAEARRRSQGVVVEGTSMKDATDLYMSKLSVEHPDQVVTLLAPLSNERLTVSKAELVKMLQEKAKTAPTQANRMLTRWKDFFNFCEQNGWIDHNPIVSVQRKFVGGKEVSRNTTLSWREIRDLYTGANRPVHFCLFFVLITGLRSSEALWVLRTKQTEKIPTKENKNPPTHFVPRTPLIRWFLRQNIKPVASDLTMSNYTRRKGYPWKPHDLRRTFSTLLNELGVAPHIVEKMLDHKLPGVMAIYNHAEYRPERYAAQRLWERELLRQRKKTPEV
jgi:integrase